MTSRGGPMSRVSRPSVAKPLEKARESSCRAGRLYGNAVSTSSALGTGVRMTEGKTVRHLRLGEHAGIPEGLARSSWPAATQPLACVYPMTAHGGREAEAAATRKVT